MVANFRESTAARYPQPATRPVGRRPLQPQEEPDEWNQGPGRALGCDGKTEVVQALGEFSAQEGTAHEADASQKSRGQAPRQARWPALPAPRRQHVRGQALV